MMPYYSIAAQLLVHAILYRYSAWQIGELPQVPGDGSQGNRVPPPRVSTASGVKVIPSLGPGVD